MRIVYILKLSLFSIFIVLFWPSLAAAKDVNIAFGLSLAPYVLEDESKGIELDIIRESLNVIGHDLVPRYFPLARIPLQIKDNSIDGATPLTKDFSKDLQNLSQEYYYSEPHVVYQNVVVTLQDNNIEINDVNDLNKYDLIAFQNAKAYLGDEFKIMADQNKNYMEMADQQKQILKLFSRETQAIVLDINIFKFYKKAIKHPRVDMTLPVHMHFIFPANHYSIVFKDQALCDEFNKGLDQIKKDGLYQEILERYQ